MQVKIVENFLDKEDLENLCSLKLKKTNEDEISIYSNKIKANNIIVSDDLKKYKIDKDIILKFFKLGYCITLYGL